MTDIPKTGFLCAGKNPLELSVSVHCAHKLMDTLKSAGFATGSCYTEICELASPEKIKHAAKTLSHLCLSNDLVITVGCCGFSAGDIMPDITDAVCPKKTVYFANVLCGSIKIAAKPECESDLYAPSDTLRFYPDETDAFYRDNSRAHQNTEKASLAAKLDSALQKLSKRLSENVPDSGEEKLTYSSTLRIMNSSGQRESKGCHVPGQMNSGIAEVFRSNSGLRHKNVYFPGAEIKESSALLSHDYFESQKEALLELPPSRASAGISDKALVLNLSNDVYTAVKLIKALMPAIGFTVYNISGKSAAAALQYEKSLKSSPECKDFFKNCSVVND